jgi:hypothetical protein
MVVTIGIVMATDTSIVVTVMATITEAIGILFLGGLLAPE